MLSAGAMFLHVRQRFAERCDDDLRRDAALVAARVRQTIFHSEPRGAVRSLGLSNIRLKAVVEGRLPRDYPGLVRSLSDVQTSFGASLVYAMDANGFVVASTTFGGTNTLTGINFSIRPYFSQAIQNRNFVEIAFGIKTLQRGIYHSAPVYAERPEGGSDTHVVGVVVIKMPLDTIDTQMADCHDVALLLSPENVVYASNCPDWLFGYIPAGSSERPHSRPEFDVAPMSDLLRPLDLHLAGAKATGGGRSYRVETFPLDMGDVRGNWSLVILRDDGAWRPRGAPALAALLAAGACGLLGITVQQRLKRLAVQAENARAIHVHRAELEQIIGKRTDALRAMESRLQHATEEHKQAKHQLRILQERLDKAATSLPTRTPEQGEQAPPVMAPLDLNELVGQVLRSDTVASLRQSRPDASLIHRLSPKSPTVQGFAPNLERLVLMVLDAALRTTPEHGTVTLQTSVRSFDRPFEGYESVPPGRYAAMVFSSSGLGFSHAELARLLDSSPENSSSLPSLQVVLRQHGGRLDTRSTPGHGSELTIFMPLSEGSESKSIA